VATKKKISSAVKAHRQSIKRRTHNRQQRSTLRSALKDIRSALDGNDVSAAKAALTETVSLVDKMANKGIIHKNTAGRYKSRLAKRLAAGKTA
jgi:small subunit ribosomal protein S20